ncbi:MAG: hypothetical protein ACKVP0_16240 [Pirellulaceae bacterium]
MKKKLAPTRTPGQILRAKNAKGMADAVRRGKSITEVAADFGKSEATVILACKLHRVAYPRKTRGAPSKIEERKHLAEAVRSGKSVADVAQETGQPARVVRTACHEQGVSLPLANMNSMKILAGILSGKSQTEVARDLNISRQRVSQVMEVANSSGVFAVLNKRYVPRTN